MSSVIAFDRPGGESIPHPRRTVPLNLAQLRSQTMGDRSLEHEVLGLFSHQAGLFQGQLPKASADERMRLAHGLKGSAMAVGAETVAECASDIMSAPGDERNVRRISAAIDEARAFIARFTR